MNADKSSLPQADLHDEFSAAIEALYKAEQRLEALTAGEVDAVSTRDGQTFLLRSAQDHLRQSQAAKQAAILNALPVHIALLDRHGLIVSVNEAWRRSAGANVLRDGGIGTGLNYLDICDGAQGEGATEAHQVAEGIRLMLAGEVRSYSLEMPLHSPNQERWFLVTVTPLADDRSVGVVVMHLDVTTEREARQSLRASETRFRQMAENIHEVFWLRDPARNEMLYVSPAYQDVWGRSCQSLNNVSPCNWSHTIHPDDRDRMAQVVRAGGEYVEEYRIERPDGEVRWIRERAFPVLRDGSKASRIAGLSEDITDSRQVTDDLRESERRFSDLLRNVELASVMLDCEARITFCNEYLLHLTGWTLDEVIGRNWYEIFVPSTDGDAKDFFPRLLANQPDTWHRENEIITRTGELRLMRWNNSLLRSSMEVIGSASIGEDITEQRRAELKIMQLSRVHAMLSGINGLIVRVRSRDELFREACRIAVEAGGFRMASIGTVDLDTGELAACALAGMDEDLLAAVEGIASSGTDAADALVVQAIAEKRIQVSNDMQKDARVMPDRKFAAFGVRSMAILPLVVADRVVGVFALHAGEREFFHAEEMKLLTELSGYIAFAVDHIGKQEQLEYLAYYDPLTGLANRSLFLERVAQYARSAANSGHGLAVFLIDLERFKSINDSLGQPAGDTVLRHVAERLTYNAGNAHLLARIDADHFAAVLPQVDDEEDVVRSVERMINVLLDHPFRLNDAVFRIAGRIGIAQFPHDGIDAGSLFRNAEAALKEAKASGERYLFYTKRMNETAAATLTLENQLRQALDRGEFVLHYQPKVNLASGKLMGAEALIRWNDPHTGKLVLPGLFIPILEEIGLIHEVGRWVLRKAVEDYLHWCEAGLTVVPIAVNVSPLQLRHPGFIAEVRQALGIDMQAAAGLELEITESLIMENVKHSIASLQAIRAMGVRIAIDDFGTGFSSLSYLAKLPVDTLKIDRSFVIEMTEGPQAQALVSTIITLAHSLKLKVVAEGVETEQQLEFLKTMGCDEMQGFLFSRDLPCEIFEARYLAAAIAG
ncbi:MAG TPA: EAL domain-containing protein [Rhodanobacter sp.]